jgi:small subunit ribosomal protein S1
MLEDTTRSADGAPPPPEDDAPATSEEFRQQLESFERAHAPESGRSADPVAGAKVRGTILRVGDDHAIVDFGGRSEGILEVRHLKDASGALKHGVGDVIDLFVLKVGDQVVLGPNLRPEPKAALQQLRASMEAKVPVSARVVAVRAGGLQVDASGVRGFCPLSQIEAGYCADPSVYVGKTLEFLVTEVGEGRRGIVVSRKAFLRRESEEKGRHLLEALKVGDELEGTVARLEAFGAFVDLGGIDGLVHVSEIRHERTAHPKDALGEGQKVKVKVLRIEAGKDGRPRIGLSIKAAAPDPWQGVADRYWKGRRVQGTVARLTDFGAFVSLEPGIDGLVHVSEAAREPVAHVKDVLAVGQPVDAIVIAADAAKHRVSLSIREAAALDAGETITRDEPAAGRGRGPRRGGPPHAAQPAGREPTVGDVVGGTVASVKPFGVFIDLPVYGRRARGLLPVEEAGERGDLARRYPAGEPVSVVVTELREGKIRLGLAAGGSHEHGESHRPRAQREQPKSDEPTTMAIALRKAMEKARERERRKTEE